MNPVYRTSLVLLCLLASAPSVLPAPLERSVSSSRQFLVYGTDARLRGAICDLAERTKRDVVNLLGQRDEWSTPIVVSAQYPQANLPDRPPASLSVSQTGFGLKLQLDFTIASDARQPEVRRELLRAILLEIIYRSQPNLAAGATYVSPPDWLLDGIQPQQSELEGRRLRMVLATPVTARKILPLTEFLRPRAFSELDGPRRSLNEAYAFALVDFLTHTPDGRGHMARYLANLPSAGNDPRANLGTHFPELCDANMAEKMWRSHIARLARGQPFELFSAEETEAKLEELLRLKIPGAGPKRNYRIDEFAEFIRNPSAKAALTKCSLDLKLLASRANPIYQPLIYEDATIVAQLARGKVRGTAKRLARLTISRKNVATTMRAINDYLNWVEATKSPAPSGAFDDYMKAAEVGPSSEQKRRDAISVYLDVLEAHFQD